jgi:hypothetical protein
MILVPSVRLLCLAEDRALLRIDMTTGNVACPVTSTVIGLEIRAVMAVVHTSSFTS